MQEHEVVHNEGRFNIDIFFFRILLLLVAVTGKPVDSNLLLDAYHSPLSALSSPKSFYFLEFPLLEGENNDDDRSTQLSYTTLSPKCGNGSPYQFVFRRGTDEHLSKLIVEFEAGPACWSKTESGVGSCCNVDSDSDSNDGYRLNTPWYDYLINHESNVVRQYFFPPLGTCTGITSGFMKEGANVLFGVGDDDDMIENDIPIFLREAGKGTKAEKWWEFIGSDGSDVQDWSYIFLPHCTLDWHLGHQPRSQATGCGRNERVYHRGGTNLQAVLNWTNHQFPSGFDALVITAGGRVGGCNNPKKPAANIYSIAPLIFTKGVLASSLTKQKPSRIAGAPSLSSILAVTEGSYLWDSQLPNNDEMRKRWNARDLVSGGGLLETAESMMMNTPNNAAKYAWIASENGRANSKLNEESKWLTHLKVEKPDLFHVYTPEPESYETAEVSQSASLSSCPRFTFPDSLIPKETKTFSAFFRNLTKQMSWSSEADPSHQRKNKSSRGSSRRLTFFSIAVILLSLVALSYVVYYTIKCKRKQVNKVSPPSPYDLWLTFLTSHPCIFLLISLLIPILLSCLAIFKSDLTVNLDFDMYLNISSEIEDTSRAYTIAQNLQTESLEQEQRNCALLNGQNQRSRREQAKYPIKTLLFDGDKHVESDLYTPPMDDEKVRRKLTSLSTYTKYKITIMYQNRNGGNVFEPKVLEQIRQFEESILLFPGCTSLCLPFDSEIPHFFPGNGPITNDIEGVLRSFTSQDGGAVLKMEQYFGPDNLKSNVTKTYIYLLDLGDGFSWADGFLDNLYSEFWKVDQEKPYLYPDMIFTWSNRRMEWNEAQAALKHDALWSAGSLIFIGVMIFLKVRSSFVFLSSMLGLVLAFSTAYYWVSFHFDIKQITLLHVSGLFVMLGIGADDIFLMVDSFEHTKFDKIFHNSSNGEQGDMENLLLQGMVGEEQHHRISERMKSAYTTAGSMMLVSSMTAAVCFFSNAFGVLVVIQEFGVYMGMVVLINYVHVMTILPAAIIVNELYIAPLKNSRTWSFGTIMRNKLFGISLPTPTTTPSDTVEDQNEDRSSFGDGQKTAENWMNVNDQAFDACVAPAEEQEQPSEDIQFPPCPIQNCISSSARVDPPRDDHDGDSRSVFRDEMKESFRKIISKNTISENFKDGTEGDTSLNQNDDSSRPADSSRNFIRTHSWTSPSHGSDTNNRNSPRSTSSHVAMTTKHDVDDRPGSLPVAETEDHGNNIDVRSSTPSGRNAASVTGREDFTGDVSDTTTSLSGAEDTNETMPTSMSQMDRMDRFLVAVYTPFLSSRYRIVVFVSIALALLLGALGIASFETADGSIVLFSDKYNLGRVQSVTDAYYSKDIQKTVDLDGFELWGANNWASYAGGHVQGANSGSQQNTNPILVGGDVNSATSEGSTAGSSGSNHGSSGSGQQQNPVDGSNFIENSGNENAGSQHPQNPMDGSDSGNGNSYYDAGPPSDVQSTLPSESPSVNASSLQNPTLEPTSFVNPFPINNLIPSENSTNSSGSPPQDNSTTLNGDVPTQFPSTMASVDGESRPNPPVGLTANSTTQTPLDSPQGTVTISISRRDAIVVRLIWGVELEEDPFGLWLIRYESTPKSGGTQTKNMASSSSSSPSFDLSEPHVQKWLYEVVRMARNETKLHVQPNQLTWIEYFREFVLLQGVEFPVPKHLFVGYLQLLKNASPDFAKNIEKEIGTRASGLSGDFTFASITLKADVLTSEIASETSVSTSSFNRWSSFVERANKEKPDNMTKVVAQSRVFLDAYRAEQTIDSTVNTWFVANGLCLLIILVFSQNVLLSLMVMVTISLIFLCLGGVLFFLFSLSFGPVEALGVSIFIGMSANYSLHVVHAYHSSNSDNRQTKMADAIFGVGSPIVASALSTIGASIFLFACRTWVFVELGILICSINIMALLYSMGFLLAWLKMIGPLPCDENNDNGTRRTCDGEETDQMHRHRLHCWDLKALVIGMYHIFCRPRGQEIDNEQQAGSSENDFTFSI